MTTSRWSLTFAGEQYPRSDTLEHRNKSSTNGGSGSLGPALLTEDEVHKVLHSYLCGYHQLKSHARSSAAGKCPELQPGDE